LDCAGIPGRLLPRDGLDPATALAPKDELTSVAEALESAGADA
jgi:hypothetical protein